MVDFSKNLSEGQLIEVNVVKQLQHLCPGCEIKNTNQDKGAEERDIYHLCDVVIIKDGKTVLGIECKRSMEKFYSCEEKYGWDGDYNTPLNNTSIRKYRDAEFPFYILNINQFCHKIFTADIMTVLKSRSACVRKDNGVIIYNYDSTNWNEYSGNVHLSEVLQDILKKEKLC